MWVWVWGVRVGSVSGSVWSECVCVSVGSEWVWGVSVCE